MPLITTQIKVLRKSNVGSAIPEIYRPFIAGPFHPQIKAAAKIKKTPLFFLCAATNPSSFPLAEGL